MAKSLLYRLFGIGKIPVELLTLVKTEGILLLDEGIRGSTTYLDFHAPGKYFSWKRQWQTAAIILTQIRLVALMDSQTVVNVPLADERIQRVRFSTEGAGLLCISLDPALFHHDWSGTVEYRFHYPEAPEFLSQLRAQVPGDRQVS